jgi:guanine deaminase
VTGGIGYRAAVLTPAAAGGELVYHDDAVLVVSRDGTVSGVHPVAGGPAPARIVHDLRGSLIVPGFVDNHVHYPQTRIVGSATGPLLEWLERSVFPEEARFADEGYARAVAREFVLACATRGTTTVGAYASSSAAATGVLFETLAESGLRAVAGLVLMDQNCPTSVSVPADVALSACRELAARWHEAQAGRLRFAIVPRFAISCSRALLEGAAAIAAELELSVMTHVSENPREEADTLAVHPWAADYLGVYEAVGLVGARTLLAHAIHLSSSEWDRVAERGAAIAHCPDSNFFLGSGVMRLVEARRRGIAVGLGTDVAAGRSFDVRRTASHAYDAALLTSAAASPAELFTLATLGGAHTLGLADRIGSLEPGKEADFVVIERPVHASGLDGALRTVLFGSEMAPVSRTYVRGRLIWSRIA